MLYGETASAIDKALGRAVGFVAAEQLPGGGFVSLSSVSHSSFVRARAYRTTFIPSIIVTSLATYPVPQSAEIIRRVAAFLQTQKSDGGSFNYWDRAAPESQKLRYPDDLDDTAAALSALYRHNPKLFDARLSASVATMLIAAETKPGGPYKTWLVDDDAPQQWQDTDVVVNANVAGLLALLGVSLPQLTAWIEECVKRCELRSPYYPDELAAIYFIARWYRGPQSARLAELALEILQKTAGKQPLRLALAASALLSVHVPRTAALDAAVQQLLDTQAADGSWPPEAFCADPALHGKTAYAGSAALTTALCIEALARYRQAFSLVDTKPAQTDRPASGRRYKMVIRRARQDIARLPAGALRHETSKLLRRLIRQDEDAQIVLLPWLIAEAFDKKVDQKMLQSLAAANLWGWMAYTAFDDFLDTEGDVRTLPAATLSLRSLTLVLSGILPEHGSFHQEITHILDQLDGANAWEIASCRRPLKEDGITIGTLPDFGDFSQLANKSLGHTIAALGVLYAAGEDTGSKKFKYLREFFYHYLIARQLNDDMHDWLDDLKRGQLNAVGTAVLKNWQTRTKKSRLCLSEHADELQLIMWQDVVPGMCALVTQHARAAQKALASLHLVHAEKLTALIHQHEAIAAETLQKRREALEFIEELTGPKS